MFSTALEETCCSLVHSDFAEDYIIGCEMDKKYYFGIFSISISIIMVLLTGEFSYRLYQYFTYDRPIFRGSIVEYDPYASPVIGHAILHYVPNPKLPDVTPDFFRATPEIREPYLRIAALGGSSTFGTAVLADDSYPAQLQRLLSESGVRVKVLNGGVPGWRLVHHMARYVFQIREILRPGDVVLLNIGANDIRGILGDETSKFAFSRILRPYESRSEFWAEWRFLSWIRTRADMLACSFGIRPIFGSHLNNRAFWVSACKDYDYEAIDNEEINLFKSRLTLPTEPDSF